MSKREKFWDKEYKNPRHLKLSDNPSEDLEKFCRWLIRDYGKKFLNLTTKIVDLGCGNGRNLIYLAREFGCRGVGFDISGEALKQAKLKGQVDGLPLTFFVQSITKPFEAVKSASADIVLDMMTSHVLKEKERENLLSEIVRMLKPGGWLFFKSFLKDEDIHAHRLLKDYPAGEKNAYIHPTLDVYEHVWTEEELTIFFGQSFEIHKIEKSHKHILHGRAFKRRTISIYLEKK